MPVLFIPGNAGSGRQARSLGAEAARLAAHNALFVDGASYEAGSERTDAEVAAEAASRVQLDVWAVDFGEELSALHGGLLETQAEYVNDAVTAMLSLYGEHYELLRIMGVRGERERPQSVVLVGHSMGGVVARLALAKTGSTIGNVNTIVTLATPHRAVSRLSPSLSRAYATVAAFWHEGLFEPEAPDARGPAGIDVTPQLTLRDMVVVSLGGGFGDGQVRGDLTSLDGLVPPRHGFSQFTAGTPGVHLATDHLNIVWCNQVVKAVANALYETIHPARGIIFEEPDARLSTLRAALRQPRLPVEDRPTSMVLRSRDGRRDAAEFNVEDVVAASLLEEPRDAAEPVVVDNGDWPVSGLMRLPGPKAGGDWSLATSLRPGRDFEAVLCERKALPAAA